MKIFYLEFFINEIFSVKKFPNYGIIMLFKGVAIVLILYGLNLWKLTCQVIVLKWLYLFVGYLC